jgi:hypothetical protein
VVHIRIVDLTRARAGDLLVRSGELAPRGWRVRFYLERILYGHEDRARPAGAFDLEVNAQRAGGPASRIAPPQRTAQNPSRGARRRHQDLDGRGARFASAPRCLGELLVANSTVLVAFSFAAAASVILRA